MQSSMLLTHPSSVFKMVVRGLYFEMLPWIETSGWDEWLRRANILVEVVKVVETGRTVQRRAADSGMTADRERTPLNCCCLTSPRAKRGGKCPIVSGRGERKNSQKPNLFQRACA